MTDPVDHRPLFITGDPAVAGELLKLAAAAGVTASQAPDAATAGRFWSSASAVVIAADAAYDCADARLPHRDKVVLLTGDRLPYDQAWPLALTMGADQVASLPDAGPWLIRRLVPPSARTPHCPVLVVTGARGGVGASVLACGLGVSAARQGLATLLIDADPQGGGLDMVLGWEGVDGLRWPDLTDLTGPFDAERLRSRLPERDGLAILSFDHERIADLPPRTLAAVLDAARTCHDLVVIDAPRHTEDWLPAVVGRGDALAIVVPGEVRAAAAARQLIARCADNRDQLRLIFRGPSPGRLTAADIAEVVGIPVAAELHTDPRLSTAAEIGGMAARARRGNLEKVSARLLRGLAEPAVEEVGR